MTRLLTCFYIAVAVLGLQQVAPMALVHLPTEWGYTFDGTCHWRPRPWVYALGPSPPVARPDEAGRMAEWKCLRGRGLKSLVIFGAHLETHWPSPATLAKWEAEEDENDYPPSPDWRFEPAGE